MQSSVDTVFESFTRAGLRWCLLRLPHAPGPSGGDIDLLIDPAHASSASDILRRLDFVRLPGWEPGFHFLKYDAVSSSWYWLHVVTELSFGPYALLQTHAEAECLDRRRRSGNVAALAPDDAFWELLFHCLIDKGDVPLRHRTRLRELAHSAPTSSPLADAVTSLRVPDWNAKRMVDCVDADDWIALRQIAPSLARAWMRRQGVGRWQLLRHRVSRWKSKLRNLTRTRGLSVALLGPDGAGKSTLMQGVQESFILPVRAVYMGLTGGLLPYVDRLRFPLFVLPGRLVVFWSRYVRARYHQWRGRLVVFDRYVYDWVVPTPYPLTRWGRIHRWIDGHSVPGPDLVLILDAPGDVMFRRKGEYDAAQLENWRQHFLTLQQRLAGTEVVDTTRPQATVRNDVIDRIWRRYAARWAADR